MYVISTVYFKCYPFPVGGVYAIKNQKGLYSYARVTCATNHPHRDSVNYFALSSRTNYYGHSVRNMSVKHTIFERVCYRSICWDAWPVSISFLFNSRYHSCFPTDTPNRSRQIGLTALKSSKLATNTVIGCDCCKRPYIKSSRCARSHTTASYHVVLYIHVLWLTICK